MRGVSVLVAVATMMAAAPAPGQGGPTDGPGPSFDCTRASTAVEHMICAGTELRALDLGVSRFYASARRGAHAARIPREQRAWLRERDACATPACLRAALSERLWRLSESVGSDLTTYDDEDADARMAIVDLGGGWYAFGTIGYWQGPTTNSAVASGAFRLRGDRGEVAAGSDEDCAFTLTRLDGDRWRLAATPPAAGGTCGGMNATVEGTYGRGMR